MSAARNKRPLLSIDGPSAGDSQPPAAAPSAEPSSQPAAELPRADVADPVAAAPVSDEKPVDEKPVDEKPVEPALLDRAPTPQVPSEEDLFRAGYPRDVAAKLVAEIRAAADKVLDDAARAARGEVTPVLEVVAVAERGFWRFGRHFSKDVTTLEVASLTPAQLAEIEKLAGMKILKVKRTYK